MPAKNHLNILDNASFHKKEEYLENNLILLFFVFVFSSFWSL
uniref:Uncharacterized protein n=1 Tax=Planktothrix agardhii TaxID=1160 RepID=A0A1J1JM59_PLAAG|nr:protein of unknown function [Planktothrix agardhii]